MRSRANRFELALVGEMDDYLQRKLSRRIGRHQEQHPQHVVERQQGVHLQPVQERQPELRFMRVEERGRDLHHLHVEHL